MKKKLLMFLLLCAMLAGCAASSEQSPSESTPLPPAEEYAPPTTEEPTHPTSEESSHPTTVRDSAQLPAAPRILTAEGLSLMEEVNQRHQAVQKREEDFSKYAVVTPSLSLEYAPSEYWDKDTLPISRIQNDCNVMIETLKSKYGPYYYFGGDEAFLAAREKILADCSKHAECTKEQFLQSMTEHLGFIQDLHFRLDNYRPTKCSYPFFYREVAFEKTESGYRTKDTQQPVSSVEGWEDLDLLFKRSLSSEGEFVYYPVVMEAYYLNDYMENRTALLPEDLVVHYQDGSSQRLSGEVLQELPADSERTVELETLRSIPVLRATKMEFDESDSDIAGKEFLSYAEALRDEPVIIVDLRRNTGGNMMLPYKWWNAFTGSKVTPNYVTLTRYNAYLQGIANKTADELTDPVQLENGYRLSDHQPDTFVENDTLVVILTSKYSGSAAETFIDLAHNVGNVLIIGENTAGALYSDATYAGTTFGKLPNSQIQIKFGSSINLFPEDESYFKEGVGFSPDIWIPSAEAEELAIALIHRIFES